jgi:AcrR family transcriptional regulator
MSPQSPPARQARPYDNTRRLAQARQTELAVVDAARRLFITNGYASTTIAGVARAAGVSAQTVYKAFGTKAALLKRVYDVTLAGDAEPVPLVDRPEFAAVRNATDGPTLLRAYAHVGRVLHERLGPLVTALHEGAAAGSPDLRDFAATVDRERLAGTGGVVARLAELGDLRAGLPVERARDALWTLNGVQVWQMLTRERGWSADEYETWLGDVIVAALVEPHA